MSVEVTIDATGFEKVILNIEKDFDDTSMKKKMAIIARDLVMSIYKNFAEGGRIEKWIPSQRVRLFGGRTLEKRGTLKGHIKPFVETESNGYSGGAEVSNLVYAKVQHFGGAVGKEAVLPARPYMVIQDEDKEKAIEIIRGVLP